MKSIYLIAALFSINAVTAQQTATVVQGDSTLQKQKIKSFTRFDAIKETRKRNI